jgi:hypothetical protein
MIPGGLSTVLFSKIVQAGIEGIPKRQPEANIPEPPYP